MKILIVDDTKSVHSFVKAMLTKYPQVEFTDVFNGEEAMDFLKKSGEPHLILLDWEMPKKNGPQTLKELKSIGIKAPVIMMTTKNSPEDIQSMLEAGAIEYLLKPFTLDILLEKIAYATGIELTHAA